MSISIGDRCMVGGAIVQVVEKVKVGETMIRAVTRLRDRIGNDWVLDKYNMTCITSEAPWVLVLGDRKRGQKRVLLRYRPSELSVIGGAK
jgi:hypothetical protein